MELIGIAAILYMLLRLSEWLTESNNVIVIKYDGIDKISTEDKEKLKELLNEIVKSTKEKI